MGDKRSGRYQAITTFFLFSLLWIPNSYSDSVFGSDNRVEMVSSMYPWSTVGKLKTNEGFCTGTLVGKRLVLTAAHCILNKDLTKRVEGPIEFHPNYIKGKSKTHSNVGKILYLYKEVEELGDNLQFDWAILQLDEPLGETYGYMGIINRINSAPQTVTSVGYSNDFRNGESAGIHMNCTIKESFALEFHHDCDQTPGASGGPFFITVKNRPFVVGIAQSQHIYADDEETHNIHRLTYSSETANHAVSTRQFFSSYKKLLMEEINEQKHLISSNDELISMNIQ